MHPSLDYSSDPTNVKNSNYKVKFHLLAVISMVSILSNDLEMRQLNLGELNRDVKTTRRAARPNQLWFAVDVTQIPKAEGMVPNVRYQGHVRGNSQRCRQSELLRVFFIFVKNKRMPFTFTR